MNEAETRQELITPAIRDAGWDGEECRIRPEFLISKGRLIGNGQRTSPLSADYVLEYKNRRIAVVEAKARNKYYTDGLGQAKDYAERLDIRFTYSTNGDRIYEADMQTGEEREIDAFPSPEEYGNEPSRRRKSKKSRKPGTGNNACRRFRMSRTWANISPTTTRKMQS